METTYCIETTARQFCDKGCDLFYKTGCMASLKLTTLALLTEKQHVVFAWLVALATSSGLPLPRMHSELKPDGRWQTRRRFASFPAVCQKVHALNLLHTNGRMTRRETRIISRVIRRQRGMKWSQLSLSAVPFLSPSPSTNPLHHCRSPIWIPRLLK